MYDPKNKIQYLYDGDFGIPIDQFIKWLETQKLDGKDLITMTPEFIYLETKEENQFGGVYLTATETISEIDKITPER